MEFIVQYRWKSFDDLGASLDLDKIEIPPFKFRIANFERRTPAGGQFGWGGTLLKRYQ